MLGGHFDYKERYIDCITSKIEEYVYGYAIDSEDVEAYITENHISETEKVKYIRERCHTMPIEYNFSDETIEEMKKAIQCLKKAAVYVRRIDYLISVDDNESDFHRCLQNNLKSI